MADTRTLRAFNPRIGPDHRPYVDIKVTKPPTSVLPEDTAEMIGEEFIAACGNVKAAVGQLVWVLVEHGLLTDRTWTT